MTPSASYSSYTYGKPFVVKAETAHKKGIVVYTATGAARVCIGSTEYKVPVHNQYDVVQPTLFGLNERLTMAATSPVLDASGKTLREAFNDEWKHYTKKLTQAQAAKGPSTSHALNYGVYAYYHGRNELVRYCDPFWHRVVATASSSKLLADPGQTQTWRALREVLETTTVAVAGGSVGNNVLHSVVMDLRPRAIKIADKSVYKMENINRVRLDYRHMVSPQSTRTSDFDSALRNKACVSAEQLYGIDPFIDVWVYQNGVTERDTERFFAGKGKEPAIDIILDEVDDPQVKILLREEARKRRIPLVMVTDVGSSVQLDVLRYDEDPTLSLTYGQEDAAVYAALSAVYDNPGDRASFFNFVDVLIGPDYRAGELGNILAGTTEIPTSTLIPQLGSTAAVAGGIAAEAVARIRLGHTYPPRMLVNKHTFQVVTYGSG